jgi:hypothetical protein
MKATDKMKRIDASMHDVNLAACYVNLSAHCTNGEPEIPPSAPPEVPPEEVPIEIPPSGPPEIEPEPSEIPPAHPPEIPQSTSEGEQKTTN